MSTTRKLVYSKEKSQALRARYTWHLRPPFKDDFDRSHWWDANTKLELESNAALYELARRHPHIGEVRLKFRHAEWHGQELLAGRTAKAEKKILSQIASDLDEPMSICCLCLIGLKSWKKLDPSEQDFWLMSAGKMKGVDCRDEVDKCASITKRALSEVCFKRAFKLKGKQKNKPYEVFRNILKEGLNSDEMRSAIAKEALLAHGQGHWLIAVAPDLVTGELEPLLADIYRQHGPLNDLVRGATQRARPRDWLALISEIENEKFPLKSQTFVRYRHAVDGIRFVRDSISDIPRL